VFHSSVIVNDIGDTSDIAVSETRRKRKQGDGLSLCEQQDRDLVLTHREEKFLAR